MIGKKLCFLWVGLVFLLVLSGCESKNETEALQRQIAQLEQKVSELEARDRSSEGPAVISSQGAASASSSAQGSSGDLSGAATVSGNDSAVDGVQTTETMEELSALVSAFEEKVNAVPPSGGETGGMESFFSLKQEEKQIDDRLDLYEDELEFQYRAGSLTERDYKAFERELERLEDRLDAAEDKLEYVFGIDD